MCKLEHTSEYLRLLWYINVYNIYCIPVYTCVYECRRVYNHVYVSIPVFTSVYNVNTHLCLFIPLYTCVCLVSCANVSIPVFTLAYLCLLVYKTVNTVYVLVYLCIQCIRMRTRVYSCMPDYSCIQNVDTHVYPFYACVYLYIPVYTCVYACISLCILVCSCGCVYTRVYLCIPV